MAERLANLGYLAIGKETTAGTAVTPSIYVPYYDESFETKTNFQKLAPVVGHKFATNQTLAGIRSHGGDITVMGEGNTAAHFFNALLTKGTTTGSNPYTHPYTVSATDPKSYTFDIAVGTNIVKRFIGVQLSSISPDWDDNELRLKLSGSALKSFISREIATVATTTLTLKTDYDPAPTAGLVVGDLVRVYKASTGATLDTTIATVNADGITVTLGASAASFAAGDMLYLRAATPAYNNLAPFTWSSTLFGFGATASAALTNATRALHTRVEQGSTWSVTHNFDDDEGAKRSGGKDPAALLRTLVDAELTVKKVFDGPEDVRDWNSMVKTACVIRHLAGSTDQYELRVTINNLTTDTPLPQLKSGEIAYSEINYILNQDAGDGQAIDVKAVDALSSV